MKQLLFSVLFVILFVACDAKSKRPIIENQPNVIEVKDNPDLTEIKENSCKKIEDDPIFDTNKTFKIIHGACGKIIYKGRIGNDFDLAMDSLIKLQESAILSTTWSKGYYVEKKILTIDFTYDNRTFYSIGFLDKVQNFPIFSLTDVLDSNGNYFVIHWCED
ncbi:MAG: hypothetical protein LBU90_00445 [Bacteroidales bacterium]|jgi:hypothetical protein|nr:hypothetical protein [Bacteroidales bacterium]